MSWSTFERLKPLFSKFRPFVVLNGHGETLLHKRFLDMLDVAVNLGCPVAFQSNGSLLNPEISTQLVRYAGRNRLCGMTFSIDAAEAGLFEEIRRGASFATFVENIRDLNRLKVAAGSRYPKLSFEMVVMRQNVHQVTDVVRLVHALGGVNLYLADLVEYDATRGDNVRNDPRARLFLDKAAEVAREIGLKLDGAESLLDGAAPALARTGEYRVKNCHDPYYLTYIDANGDVRPCCVIPDAIGNINERPFEEIWNSAGYCAIRTAMDGPSPPAPCQTCTLRDWKHFGATYQRVLWRTRFLVGQHLVKLTR